jgi:Protein of unknown function (DUF3780)
MVSFFGKRAVAAEVSQPAKTGGFTGFTGFGASGKSGANVFKLALPADPDGVVVLSEQNGPTKSPDKAPGDCIWAELEAAKWTPLANVSRDEFNRRLRARNEPSGAWRQGDTLLDSVFGKELCVLMWAAQKALSAQQLEAACVKWSSMLPEERRWVYARCFALAPSPKTP